MKIAKLRSAAFARTVIALGLTSLTFLLLFQSHYEFKAEAEYLSDVDSVAIIPPSSKPKAGQAAIDLAMVMYGIRVPESAMKPTYDPNLADRGLTTRGAFMEKAVVNVGRSAFSSWALLGSTLAHEIEVHCNQNFFFIFSMDLIGLDGTGEAERQAYNHELAHSKRFGLKDHDATLISDTVAFYYPTESKGTSTSLASGNGTSFIQSWLARNFLTSTEL